MVMKTFQYILIALVIALFSHSVGASELRPSSPLYAGHLSGVDVLNTEINGKNLWIFTAPDQTGIDQVFYQEIDANSSSSGASLTVQLTFGGAEKKKAKFGGEIDLMFTQVSQGTTQGVAGIAFYYLTDSDGDSKTEIHLGCLNKSSLGTNTAIVDFDIKLTGYDSATNFDVQDYDVSKLNQPTTLSIFSISAKESSYPVVFTDSANALHMLMFSSRSLYDDTSNITSTIPRIVYDYTDVLNVYSWNSTTINTNNQFFEPKLDSWANNIIYSVKSSTNAFRQLGGINITGKKQRVLSNFSTDVIHPRFHKDHHMLSNSTMRTGRDVFFELKSRGRHKNRVAYLPVEYTLTGISNWCNTAAFITDDTFDRFLEDLKFTSTGQYTGQTTFLFKQTQPDQKQDVYSANLDWNLATFCDTNLHRADGTRIDMNQNILVPVNQAIDISSHQLNHTQITCQNSTTDAHFLPSFYHDQNFNLTTSPNHFSDVIARRTESDGQGQILVHIYDTDNSTHECADNCFETANGQPIVDVNLFSDGDGIADSCENPTCEQMVIVDLLGDADGDTIANNMDNCPCTINTDQSDSDADSWGDLCDVEFDECGTTDTDLDGVFDDCDECDTDASLTTLAYDNNNDGVMDSCVALDPCGNIDTDGDGTNDACDACPNDSTQTTFGFDFDHDGINESCVADSCGSVDTDGDGTFDRCDACPEDPEHTTLFFDVNDDGKADSCVGIVLPIDPIVEPGNKPPVDPVVDPEIIPDPTTDPEPEPTDPEPTVSPKPSADGGFSAMGGAFGCSLHTEQKSNTTNQGTVLSLALLFGLCLTARIKHQKQSAQAKPHVSVMM